MENEQPKKFDVRIMWVGSEKYVEDVTGYSIEEGNLFLSGEFDGKQWIECVPLKHVLEYRMDEVS